MVDYLSTVGPKNSRVCCLLGSSAPALHKFRIPKAQDFNFVLALNRILAVDSKSQSSCVPPMIRSGHGIVEGESSKTDHGNG